jgi:hypothetical protein
MDQNKDEGRTFDPLFGKKFHDLDVATHRAV